MREVFEHLVKAAIHTSRSIGHFGLFKNLRRVIHEWLV